ncbi:hypothetical protein [Streptomyces sp. NPDC008092]
MSDAGHRAVEGVRERAVAMFRERGGPFAAEANRQDRHTEPGRPAPALP